jgi:prolipoprotein diacylglyceryl transferase
MYPKISDLIKEFFGIYIPLPIQTYGFFVAVGFLTASYILLLEFKRKEKLGILKPFSSNILIGKRASFQELFFSGFIGFLIGYKLLDAILRYSDFVNNPQQFVFSPEGNLIGGVIVGALLTYLKYREKENQRLPEPRLEEKVILASELSGNILLVAALAGILGAKLFHILENMGDFIKDPFGNLFSFSGLSFFGGLICGTLTVLIYCTHYKIKPLHLLDSGAPAIALGYGIGRVGCQMSGDGCWGIENLHPKPEWLSFLPDWMWGFDFPHNVVRYGKLMENCSGDYCYSLPVPVYPTSFYETLLMVVIFIILWSLRKKIKIPGVFFSSYLILAGIERFFIELVRVNNTYQIFSMKITQAEIISVTLFILGNVGMILLLKNKAKLIDY